jgi:hypothetical protein
MSLAVGGDAFWKGFLNVLPIFPEGMGAAWLIASGPPVLGLALMGAWLIENVLERVEWLAFRWKACPKCGMKRWSRGFTSGFGL